MKPKTIKKNLTNIDDNEEISLTKLILILVRYRKLWMIIFSIIFFSGVLIFITNKKVMESRAKNVQEKARFESNLSDEIILNEVSHGYIWVNYREKDSHIHSTDEVLDYLFNNGDLALNFTKWPGLICRRVNGMISFLWQNQEILRIKINVDNSVRKTGFITEKLKINTTSSTRIFDNDDINKINDIVLNTYITQANIRINNFKNVRQTINEQLGIEIKKKKGKFEDKENMLLFYSIVHSPTYMFLEKEYIQTVFNAHSISQPTGYVGISFKKFLVLYWIISLFVSMLLIYFWEFSRESNLVSEIKKAINESKG